jgi:hypothetical protein
MNPGDPTQGAECLLNRAAGEPRSILVRKKEGSLTVREVAAPAEGYMGIQHLGKLWPNRNQTAFIKLALRAFVWVKPRAEVPGLPRNIGHSAV